VLAHASGEWIASEWPVCPTSDTTTPHRMGAALTYARRYALFTLVGIAGEDDLDAPDHADGACPPTDPGGKPTELLINSRPPPGRPGNGHARGASDRIRSVPLAPDQSSTLRDTIQVEINGLQSADHATNWARKILPAKNSLSAADAKLVEEAFARKLSELSPPEVEQGLGGPDQTAGETSALTQDGDDPPTGIDKSVLTIALPRRYRNKEHLRFVAQQACLVCARMPSDPHHLRFMQPRALGRKVSDEFTVPLCRVHHRAIHRTGDERAWWTAAGIDPTKTARSLWRRTRGTQRGQRDERPAKSVRPEIASPPVQTVGPIDGDTGTQAGPTTEDRMTNRLPT
jgi:ERF superfamily